MDFQYLIDPITTNDFFEVYWACQPVHVPRDSPGYYEDLFARRNLEAMITQCCLRYPEVAIFRDGNRTPIELLFQAGWMKAPTPITQGEAKLSCLHRAYCEGYTINARADCSWSSIGGLCRQIENLFHHISSAGFFLTPRESRGFPLHSDDFDVFILQIDGAKYWDLYSPHKHVVGAVPHKEVTMQPTAGKATFPEDALLNVSLNPGDFLYIPRGYPHEGYTLDSSSLHLSIGLRVFEWKDLISEALEEVSNQDAEYHTGLPPGFMRGELGRNFQDYFQRLLVTFAESAKADVAVNRLKKKFCERRSAVIYGQFSQLDMIDRITADSIVERRPDAFWYIYSSDQSIFIALPTGSAVVPCENMAYLEFVTQTQGTFRIGDMPGTLDESAKVKFVQNLIRIGMVRIAAVQARVR